MAPSSLGTHPHQTSRQPKLYVVTIVCVIHAMLLHYFCLDHIVVST